MPVCILIMKFFPFVKWFIYIVLFLAIEKKKQKQKQLNNIYLLHKLSYTATYKPSEDINVSMYAHTHTHTHTQQRTDNKKNKKKFTCSVPHQVPVV